MALVYIFQNHILYGQFGRGNVNLFLNGMEQVLCRLPDQISPSYASPRRTWLN